MASCDHISWLRITGKEDFCLHYGNRAKRVIQEMTNPDSQFPSSVLFLGRKSKETALRLVFPHNNVRRCQQDGIINLRLDTSTFNSTTPLMFADGDPLSTIPLRTDFTSCHENQTTPITWTPPQNQTVLNTLYTRLFFLFSDVVCIFADDFGGLGCVARLLTEWISIGSASTLPKATRSRVIIITSNDADCITPEILIQRDLKIWRSGDHDQRSNMFSSIAILCLEEPRLSLFARHQRLKDAILKETDLSRTSKMEGQVLFSATHLQAFFHQAVHHTARSLSQPFNFLLSSRARNEITEDYRCHLSTFLRQGQKLGTTFDSIASFIASSILMDSYPPRMHSKFIRS